MKTGDSVLVAGRIVSQTGQTAVIIDFGGAQWRVPRELVSPGINERRERIAAACMGGYLAAGYGYAPASELAIRATDALIAELDKEKS